jgi:hypothetical protein
MVMLRERTQRDYKNHDSLETEGREKNETFPGEPGKMEYIHP